MDTSSKMLIEIAENQESVYEFGYGSGHDKGYKEGADDTNEQIEYLNDELEKTLNGGDTGYKSHYHEFWDSFTYNGTRTDYQVGFYKWGAEYIRPNRKIIPTDKVAAVQTFNNCPNLKKIEADYFDFSQKKRGASAKEAWYYTFGSCGNLEEIEDVGLQPDFGYYSTFSSCSKLHTIAVIRVDENTVFSNPFYNCYELVNLKVEGIIGHDFIVRYSTKLSKASIESVINALSTTTSGLTVTLSQTAVNNAFTTDEWNALINTKTNWTISLV